MGRVRARDFDFTIRRPVRVDLDRTVKRRRVDLAPTVKRAIDVEKAFALDAATERGEAARVAPDAADDAPGLDVELPELQGPAPVRASIVMSRARRVRPRAEALSTFGWVLVGPLLLVIAALIVALLRSRLTL